MSTRKTQLLRRIAGKKGRSTALTEEEKALRAIGDAIENGEIGGGGETYDIDIVGRDAVWTLVAGSFEDIKTRLINGDVFNCRIRSCSTYNSEAYYAASINYNMEDEDIGICVLGISTATVKVYQVVIRPDNSVVFYYS